MTKNPVRDFLFSVYSIGMDAPVEGIKVGLTDSLATAAHARYGYNELPVAHDNVLLAYLKNFWGPMPWLMEMLIAISFFSGQKIEAWVIVALMIINSLISSFQRRSANNALAALTKNLSTNARVMRNNEWQDIVTRELVPGDIIRVRTGNIVPADAVITQGSVSVDMSSLTGESLPRDLVVSGTIFSGCIVTRGEATAKVTAIGAATAYGKTTTLLETSHPPTHMEKIIFAMIKYLFVMNMLFAVVIVWFGVTHHVAALQMINFVIVLLITSVPISFPAMFTIAQSYGAQELSKSGDEGVLVRRLAAVQECAMVDVLCSDKTGTLTQNKLKVSGLVHYSHYTDADLLGFAAACSEKANGGPIDSAILSMVIEKKINVPAYKNFVPFDPINKRTEAEVTVEGETVRALMGLPTLLLSDDVACHEPARADILRWSVEGFRVVAVIIVRDEHTAPKKECVGLIALSDPIKEDAPRIIQELNGLGVRVVMITGDGRATAEAIAKQLGLKGAITTASELKEHPEKAIASVVFAEAFPEDKLTIIRALQQAGHTVGMTGDGVNDAPALRQAEVGIAVFGATDVAKQAASFILTSPGLEGVVRAVKVSRGVYARLRTWALNKIIKSIEVSLFTTVIFFITRSYILSPLLAVLLLFANDFVTMAMATDKNGHVERPARWNIGRFAAGAAIIACVPIALLFITYHFGVTQRYSTDTLRTLIYLALIFYGKANLYAIRAWPRAWAKGPSKTLIIATIFSCSFSLVISLFGIFISPLVWGTALFVIVMAIANFFVIDRVKTIPFVRQLLGV
jgi:H+-transporting ATPase